MSVLFKEIIFGPLRSRRFGLSLGINVLPDSYKFCTFDCIYCECGWTKNKPIHKPGLFQREEIKKALIRKHEELAERKQIPENLTFAGNGEPTLHPEFEGIIEDTVAVRDKLYPEAKITVLSNASRIHKPSVNRALRKADNNVLKLDCGTEKMFRLINRPSASVSFKRILDNLKTFKGNMIIQSLFVRGEYKGEHFDNTTEEEVAAWIGHLKEINPTHVMIYSIARRPPVDTVYRIPQHELKLIAEKAERQGIKTLIY